MKQYMLFRNDDIAYGCDVNKYREVQKVFEDFGIKEMYSVVPFGSNIYEDPFKFSLSELNSRLGNKFVFDDKEVDDFIKESLQRGHSISLHGWSHTRIALYDYEKQLEYITEAKNLLENQYGVKIEYFIPPFNNYNDSTVRVCYELGLKILGSNDNQLEWLVRDDKPFIEKDYCWYHAWRFDDTNKLKLWLQKNSQL